MYSFKIIGKMKNNRVSLEKTKDTIMSNHFFKTFKSDLRYIAESNVSDWDKTLVNYSTNIFGMNPLHLLCSIKNVKEREEKITYLLDNGVDKSQVDSSGYLPVDYLLKRINENNAINFFDIVGFKSASPFEEESLITNYIQRSKNIKQFIEQKIKAGHFTEKEAKTHFNMEMSHLSRDLCNIYQVWNNTVDIIRMLPDNLSRIYGKNTIPLDQKISDIINKINRRIKFIEPLSLEREMEKKTLHNFLQDNTTVDLHEETPPPIRKTKRI